MNWRIGLSMLCILAGGVAVAFYAIQNTAALYNASVEAEDVDPELLIRNAERSFRLLPLVSGGSLVFGLSLAGYEIVRAKLRRR